MQKFSTEIETEDKEKKVITVWLDDETARLLNECGDETLKHTYIVEEYRAQLIERKETRRHQSLEGMIGLGKEIADERADTERRYEKNEEYAQLHKALKVLTKKQLYIVKLHVLKEKTFKEIAEKLGLNSCTVKEHYNGERAREKCVLLNFFTR